MHGIIARVDGRGSATGRMPVLCMPVLCMVLAGASFGCGTARSPLVDPDEARIHIEVQNRTFEDATIHAVWTGNRRRLGTVLGITTAEYRLSWTDSDVLQLEIKLLAGPGCTTRQIVADPGDIIVLEIRPGPRFCGW